MTEIEQLADRIARARKFFRSKTNLELRESAIQLLHAASACGQGLTLNPGQAQALYIHLDSEGALRSVRRLQPGATPAAESNIIPFAVAGQN